MQSNQAPEKKPNKISQDFLTIMEKFCLKTSDRSKPISTIAKEIFKLMQEVNESKNEKVLTNKVEVLRRLLFTSYNNFELPPIYAGDVGFNNLIGKLLYHLADQFPLNEDDPVLFDRVLPDDRFFTITGQQFSLKNLIDYNRERFYKGSSLGEGHQQKFLLNPLTNKIFSHFDSERLISAAIDKGLDLNFLADATPLNDISSPIMATPKQFYQLLSMFRTTVNEEDKKPLAPKGPPHCVVSEDKWQEGRDCFKRFKSYLINNNVCIRRMVIDVNKKDKVSIILQVGETNCEPCLIGQGSPRALSADRNERLEQALIKNGITQTNPLVECFPNGDHYLARSFEVSGKAHELEKIWPIILKSIKEIEGEKVFGIEEDFLQNFIAKLLASSSEKNRSSLKSGR